MRSNWCLLARRTVWGLAAWVMLAGVGPLCAAPAGAATDIPWLVHIEDAQAAARKSGKPVYYFIYYARQTACMRMRFETFKNPLVIERLQQFECCAVDAAVKANQAFVERYASGFVQDPKAGIKVGRFPANLFTDAQGQDQYIDWGYVGSPAFALMLSHVQRLVELKGILVATPDAAAAHLELAKVKASLELQTNEVALADMLQHLERAKALDVGNKEGVQEEATLWLYILRTADDPTKAYELLTQFSKDYPGTRHLATATFYRASALVMQAEDLRDAKDENGADAKLRQAMQLLAPFKVKREDTTSVWATSEFSLQAMSLEQAIGYQLGVYKEPGQ